MPPVLSRMWLRRLRRFILELHGEASIQPPLPIMAGKETPIHGFMYSFKCQLVLGHCRRRTDLDMTLLSPACPADRAVQVVGMEDADVNLVAPFEEAPASPNRLPRI